MREYRNYIFDLYGTLIDIHTDENHRFLWDAFSMHLSNYYGVSYHPQQLRKTYLSLCRQETERLEKVKGFSPVEIDIGNVFAGLCRKKDVEINEQQTAAIAEIFRILSTRHLQLFPHVKTVLQQLKDRGKKICLLSNAQQLFTDREIDLLGLRPYFDAIFYSSAYGCRKPDARFFDCLFEGHGLDRQDSVMIGNDYYDDIQSAHRYGLDTIYIHTEQSRRFRGQLPDNCVRIDDLSELLKKQ